MCSDFSKVHGLVACGGEDGAVECFDMRMRSSVGRINAVEPGGDPEQVGFPTSWPMYMEVVFFEFDSCWNFFPLYLRGICCKVQTIALVLMIVDLVI